MKLAITMKFHDSVHVLRISTNAVPTEAEKIRLKNALEVTPVVLKIAVEEEIDWKAEALAWKKQVADLTKKLGAAAVESIPAFTVIPPK